MTPQQIEMARHALGLEMGRTRSYRNYYAASIGSERAADWDDLVRQGLAVRGRDQIYVVGFSLTRDGAASVLRPGETLDVEDFPEPAQLGRE